MWPQSPDPLLKDTLDLWSSRALAAGQQLDVFAELGKGPRTAARLAATLGLAADGARDLLDALLALGWLQREGDDADAMYVSTRAGAHYLDPRSPAYLGDLLQAAREPLRAAEEQRLNDALRAGTPASPPSAWEAQHHLMRRRLGRLHGQALALLTLAPPPSEVLCLNDADASLACAWAVQAAPATRFTCWLPADAATEARAQVQAAGLGSRVQVQVGPPAAGEHDLLVFNLVLAPGDSAWRRAQLQQARRLLTSGARALLLDHLADDARRLQVAALVFGLAQRMTGRAPGTRTEGDLRADALTAGLQPRDIRPLPGGACVLITEAGAD